MCPDSTKEKIIQAAQQVFIRKGMDGARMQEIADEAGINKALLHYYFHSKEQLFNDVFYGVLSQLIPGLIEIFKGNEPFLEKIEAIVAEYDTYMSKNPFLPQFVIREINRDPDQLSRFMSDQGLDFSHIEAMIEIEVNKGNIRPISFPHLFANLIGMIVMPYIGRPLFQRKLFRNDPVKYDQFLQERKAVITSFVKQSLKVER
ncbi:MAG: TetR/AcrR family transcriptional regulator [Prolixibacteraceae bacterium]|jgi:AcrR family transcriptional regulator|nr:TetR/AcrR family transcriptional regulator [Prolixibacteraceae bacterium]